MDDPIESNSDQDVKKSDASSTSFGDSANQVIIIFSMYLETTVESHYLKL